MQPIDTLVDKINGDTLEANVTVLKRIVQRAEMPSFVTGYCAAEDEIYLHISDYIREKLSIPINVVREVELQNGMRNLSDFFREHKTELQSLPSDVILVKARYFERLLAGFPKEHYPRVAHDFDQDLGENQNKRRHDGLDKKIVVVTQISRSLGEDMYNSTVRSACASQHSQFGVYEFS